MLRSQPPVSFYGATFASWFCKTWDNCHPECLDKSREEKSVLCKKGVIRLFLQVKLRLQMLPSEQHFLSAVLGCQKPCSKMLWHASISACLTKATKLRIDCPLLQTILLMPCNGKDKWTLISRGPLWQLPTWYISNTSKATFRKHTASWCCTEKLTKSLRWPFRLSTLLMFPRLVFRAKSQSASSTRSAVVIALSDVCEIGSKSLRRHDYIGQGDSDVWVSSVLDGISHSDSALYTWGTNESFLCYWSHFSGIKTCVSSSSCRCRWSTNSPHCSRLLGLVFAASLWTLLYIHWAHTTLSEIVMTSYSIWQRRSRSLWCISAGIWCQCGKSSLDWLNLAYRDTRFHALICLLKCRNHKDGVPGTVCSQAMSRWTMRCIACGKL